jgi:sugar lactone lactonase YvrE
MSSSPPQIFEGSRVEVASTISCELGEGAIWHAGLRKYLTVDIYGPSTLCSGPAVYLHDTYANPNSLPQCIPMPSYCGTVVPSSARGGSSELLVALADGFHCVDISSGTLKQHIANPDTLAPLSNRWNDGKCSPEGRFWAGSMGAPGKVEPGVGGLFVLDTCGGEARRVLSGVTISNGLAWTADGKTMYYIDTVLQRVDAFDYDAEKGDISNRRTAFTIPAGTGHPDGCAIDAAGNLWVAHWGGSRVVAFSPSEGGRIIAQVNLPAAHISSVTFGGDHLSDLFITSAKEHLSAEEKIAQPNAGNCFIVRDCGFKGVPACVYKAE